MNVSSEDLIGNNQLLLQKIIPHLDLTTWWSASEVNRLWYQVTKSHYPEMVTTKFFWPIYEYAGLINTDLSFYHHRDVEDFEHRDLKNFQRIRNYVSKYNKKYQFNYPPHIIDKMFRISYSLWRTKSSNIKTKLDEQLLGYF